MKKILVMTMAALAVGMAAADYVYWAVDGSQATEEFSYVTVMAGSAYLYDPELGESYTKFYAAPDTGMAGPMYSAGLAGDYMSDLTFYVWNGSGVSFANFIVNYDSWKEHAYGNMGTTGATPLTLTVNVPEPTGGLLLLLGVAGLALRRKRA